MTSTEQPFDLSMPGVDPHWFDDYRRACSELSLLYATAFNCMEVELGEAAALALAPVLLPRVVAAAEQEAGFLAQQREQRRLQQLAEEQWQANPPAPVMAARAENPW